MADSTIRSIDKTLSELGFELQELWAYKNGILTYARDDRKIYVEAHQRHYSLGHDHFEVSAEEKKRRSEELDQIETQLRKNRIEPRRTSEGIRHISDYLRILDECISTSG